MFPSCPIFSDIFTLKAFIYRGFSSHVWHRVSPYPMSHEFASPPLPSQRSTLGTGNGYSWAYILHTYIHTHTPTYTHVYIYIQYTVYILYIPAPSKCSRICAVSGIIAFPSSCQLFWSASDFCIFPLWVTLGEKSISEAAVVAKMSQECSNHSWDALNRHDETGVPESLVAETMETHFKP